MDALGNYESSLCIYVLKDCPCIGSVRKFQPSNYLLMKLPQNQPCWSSSSTSLEIQKCQFGRLIPLSSVCYFLLSVFPCCKELAVCGSGRASPWPVARPFWDSLVTATGPGSADLSCSPWQGGPVGRAQQQLQRLLGRFFF